jgi:hypothetical protein
MAGPPTSLFMSIQCAAVVAGGFDGSLAAWKLNIGEALRLEALPAKR